MRVLSEAAKTIADAESQGLALIIQGHGIIEFFLYSPSTFMASLNASDGTSDVLNEAGWNSMVGMIMLDDTGSSRRSAGPCRDAYQVRGPAADAGYGPLMYDIAMSWASERGRPITSDRANGFTATSQSARKVWRHYADAGAGTHGSVVTEPFDNIYDPRTPPITDDCVLASGPYPALNAAYSTKNPVPLAKLLRNHEDHTYMVADYMTKKLGREFNKHLVTRVITSTGDDFFDHQARIRPFIKENRALHEDEGGGGFDYAGGMGEMPYGMHFGSPGQLYNTFVKPFVDVGKTAAGKTAELSARAQAEIGRASCRERVSSPV